MRAVRAMARLGDPAMKTHWLRFFSVVALAACARKAPTPAAQPPRDAAAPPVARPAPPPAPAPPPVPTVATPEARIAALQARRPRVELVPNACDHGACLIDEATGLVRATRGFASRTTTARLRGEIIVAVPRGDGSVETPYTGSLWRWNLARDRVTRLGERVGGEWETRVYESSFGVIIEDNASSQASTTRVYDGHADIDEGEARSDDPSVITASVGDLIIVDGTTYEFSGEREEITVLQRDGDAVVREPFVDLGRSAPDALLLLGTRGHPWVGRIYLRERPVRFEWVMLPSREKRTLTFDGLTGTVGQSSVDNTLYVYDETHTHRVDLATGATAPIARAEVRQYEPPVNGISAQWPIAWKLHRAYVEWMAAVDVVETGPAGFRVHPLDPPDADAGVACACDGAALACPDGRVEGACATVEGLATINRASRASQLRGVSTLYTPGGRFRLDGIDLSVVRITRLRDGARIWVRQSRSGLMAQADDGAYCTNVNEVHTSYSVRWGPSLLDAPVTTLAAQRASLERPTLVADFFSDRPLPAAGPRL